MTPMKTSESHSQANQGSPALVKENMSAVGTRPFFRIHSPVRMCHPVSESVSSHATPDVHQNSTRIGITKARSDKDGSSENRAPPGFRSVATVSIWLPPTLMRVAQCRGKGLASKAKERLGSSSAIQRSALEFPGEKGQSCLVAPAIQRRLKR